METEKISELIEEFIEDLSAGRQPRIYTLLEQQPQLKEDLEPELQIVLALRQAPLPMPASREARILSRIFEEDPVAESSAISMTLANLLASNDSLIQQARAKGLTEKEIEALRKDKTSLQVKDTDRSIVVSAIARRWNIRFWQLREFMNGVLNSLAQSSSDNTYQSSFARKDEENRPEDQR